ncbi:MAG: carbonic anhydrase family protein [Gammaproteobacteria bacterium]|nr:carbonic anhydrase family protein [Gammaproteobacteria bacterium]
MIVLLTIASEASSGAGGHWSYSGPTGPEQWGELDPAFVRCSDGRNQSPIDLADATVAGLGPVQIDYAVAGGRVFDSGHAVQVDTPPGNRLLIDGREFVLLQYHLHLPGEHLRGGESYPLEVHFVHADAEGQLAVLGVHFVEGEPNTGLEAIVARLPAAPDAPAWMPEDVGPAALLPDARTAFRYNGSLTTPPCSEGVRWFVFDTAMTASSQQLGRLRATTAGGNNRPPQPLYARPLLR